MSNIIDKLVEYRKLTLEVEEYRKKRPGWKLKIDISPNVKIKETWEKSDKDLGDLFQDFSFPLKDIDTAITRLKDLKRYYEKK